MNIRLKNIGLISESSIDINGLTVIAGHNGTGKTTVGKVMYSLVDALSDVELKAENDKYVYAIEKLKEASENFKFHYALSSLNEMITDETLRIFFSKNYEKHINVDNMYDFLIDLNNALDKFDIFCDWYQELLGKYYYNSPSHKLKYSSKEQHEEEVLFDKDILATKDILSEILAIIGSDDDLISYRQNAINATLLTEFYNQIQTISKEEQISQIVVCDDEICCDIKLIDNKIINLEKTKYNIPQYKRAFLIDDPYVLDNLQHKSDSKYSVDKMVSVDKSHQLSHGAKLAIALSDNTIKSVLKTSIINEKFKEIQAKLDVAIPGDFSVINSNSYYVNENGRVRVENLATGCKLFSIIKILFMKGKLDNNTLLILDEPESHLHPEWQNLFAEVVILLVKMVGCHILLTTHSSNFMLAIDAYMRKYNVEDMCNFYYASLDKNTGSASYDCMNDSMNKIYADFVAGFSEVKELRDEFMDN